MNLLIYSLGPTPFELTQTSNRPSYWQNRCLLRSKLCWWTRNF